MRETKENISNNFISKSIILILFTMIVLIIALFIPNKVEAVEGEGEEKVLEGEIKVTITSDVSLDTKVKKGQIITYTVTLKNETNTDYVNPAINLDIPYGTKFISITTTSMFSVDSDEESATCIGTELNAGDEQIYEFKVKVLGSVEEILFPNLLFILVNSNATDEELEEIYNSEEYANIESREEMQALFGEKMYFGSYTVEDKHILDKESLVNGPKIGEGIEVSITSTPSKDVVVKNGDIITYIITIKNSSERDYIWPDIWATIPDGTEYVSFSERRSF